MNDQTANFVLPNGDIWITSAAKISEYLLYHRKVVDECVRLTNEKFRLFYDGLDYREEWETGEDAEETAMANVDATDWEEEVKR